MSWKFFSITNLITRPIGILCICYLGSGTLIPYEGYYLIAWAFILIALVILFVLSIKYQSKIEEFVDKINNKINLKRKTKKIKPKIENLDLSDGENEKDALNKHKNEWIINSLKKISQKKHKILIKYAIDTIKIEK